MLSSVLSQRKKLVHSSYSISFRTRKWERNRRNSELKTFFSSMAGNKGKLRIWRYTNLPKLFLWIKNDIKLLQNQGKSNISLYFPKLGNVITWPSTGDIESHIGKGVTTSHAGWGNYVIPNVTKWPLGFLVGHTWWYGSQATEAKHISDCLDFTTPQSYLQHHPQSIHPN